MTTKAEAIADWQALTSEERAMAVDAVHNCDVTGRYAEAQAIAANLLEALAAPAEPHDQGEICELCKRPEAQHGHPPPHSCLDEGQTGFHPTDVFTPATNPAPKVGERWLVTWGGRAAEIEATVLLSGVCQDRYGTRFVAESFIRRLDAP